MTRGAHTNFATSEKVCLPICTIPSITMHGFTSHRPAPAPPAPPVDHAASSFSKPPPGANTIAVAKDGWGDGTREILGLQLTEDQLKIMEDRRRNQRVSSTRGNTSSACLLACFITQT